MRLNRSLMAIAVSFWGVSLLSGCGGQEGDSASELRIVGGQPIPDGQADIRRWATVALTTDLRKDPNTAPLIEQNHSFCSGTVINEYAIMTAAHCLQAFDPQSRQKLPNFILPKEENFVVFFGTKVDKGGTWVRARKVVPHPDWDTNQTLSPQPTSAPNDIGVIILSEKIPAAAKVATIGRPSDVLQKDQKLHLSGFGVTQSRNNNDTGILRAVDVPVTGVDDKAKRFGVGAFMQGACAGDSGGPAYANVNGTWTVIGATSTGAEIGGMCLGLMNNYTDARHYTTWIDSVLKQNGL